MTNKVKHFLVWGMANLVVGVAGILSGLGIIALIDFPEMGEHMNIIMFFLGMFIAVGTFRILENAVDRGLENITQRWLVGKYTQRTIIVFLFVWFSFVFLDTFVVPDDLVELGDLGLEPVTFVKIIGLYICGLFAHALALDFSDEPTQEEREKNMQRRERLQAWWQMFFATQ